MSIAALIERAAALRAAAQIERGVTAAEVAAASADEQLALAHARGRANELRVLAALRALPLPGWLVSVRAGGAFEDLRGADIVVITDVGRLWIQVKSSWAGAAKFRKGRDCPGRIGVVVVPDSISQEQLGARALAVIETLRAARMEAAR